jgi:hypothetical protein
MKSYISIIVLFFTLLSCTENPKENSVKAAEKNAAVFASISKKWKFEFPKTNAMIQTTLNEWNEWSQFKSELEQKPKTSLLAFQMKIGNVAIKSDSLDLTVPKELNNPQVRSRLVTLKTKINALDTYINLQEIPEKKVFGLISDINSELKGVYGQWEEIYIKKAIPKEIGEEEMLKALDTTRMANSKFLEDSMLKSNPIKEK